MTYSEKLLDPRWQKKRLEILQRDNFTCVFCGDHTSPLHVHHLEYGPEPWDIPDDRLETLCEKCHDSRHAFQKAFVGFIKGLSSHDLKHFKEVVRIFKDF